MNRVSQSASSFPSSSPLSSSSKSSIALHSPASQFVGTPFTTPSSASSPFEYPFPKDSQPHSIASSAGSSPSSAPGLSALHYRATNPPPSAFVSSPPTNISFLSSTRGTKSQPNGILQDSRRRGSMPIPIPSPNNRSISSADQQALLSLGLRSSSVPVPPSLIEKARRRGVFP